MISSVLQRLETSGGNVVSLDRPQRWFVTSPPDRFPSRPSLEPPCTSTSSGRIRSSAALEAERVDDGVLITAPSGLCGERIVWIGDVELELADGLRAPGTPRFRVAAEDASVEVIWALAAEEVRVRLTLPCRPVGELTFENDALDPRVEMLPGPAGATARIRPYPGLPALRIAFDGDLRFEADPCWRRGVEVLDASGAHRIEDRFSPGVFTVRRPAAARILRLVARVDPVDHAVAAGSPAGPTDGQAAAESKTARELSELLAMPGFVAAGAVPAEEAATWFTAHAADVPGALSDSGAFAHDGPLWLARAALLLERAWAATVPELSRDILQPGVERIADAILERAESAGGDPAAAFRGALRWFEVYGASPRAPQPAVGVETGALLHQLLVHAARIAEAKGDAARATLARGAALRTRRWFQRAFWMPTPRRLADVEIDRVERGDSAPLALRPHMLLAASLEGAPLDVAQRRAVVHAADEHLLTALGVRSLAAEDDLHDPRSLVDGAVWPWLLGPHVEASLRAFGHERGRARAHRILLEGLRDAPQAWYGRGGDASPLGALDFPPASGEAARARAMLDSGSHVESGP